MVYIQYHSKLWTFIKEIHTFNKQTFFQNIENKSFFVFIEEKDKQISVVTVK